MKMLLKGTNLVLIDLLSSTEVKAWSFKIVVLEEPCHFGS